VSELLTAVCAISFRNLTNRSTSGGGITLPWFTASINVLTSNRSRVEKYAVTEDSALTLSLSVAARSNRTARAFSMSAPFPKGRMQPLLSWRQVLCDLTRQIATGRLLKPLLDRIRKKLRSANAHQGRRRKIPDCESERRRLACSPYDRHGTKRRIENDQERTTQPSDEDVTQNPWAPDVAAISQRLPARDVEPMLGDDGIRDAAHRSSHEQTEKSPADVHWLGKPDPRGMRQERAVGLKAFVSALSNVFRSKLRSASRSLSSAVRVLAEIGFLFFVARRFVGTPEL